MQSAPTHDSVIFGLLDASVENLRSQGMTKMFIDGVATNLDLLVKLGEPLSTSRVTFQADILGFREWAQYRDVWKDI
jgi:methyl coenzyme M reductase gamma subunit